MPTACSSTKSPWRQEIKPNTLKTVVSMAVPVFVAPASGPVAKGQAALKASLAKDVISIELSNTGKANLKLREWVVSSPKAGELLKVPSAAYVLAGNTLTGDYPLTIQADGPLQVEGHHRPRQLHAPTSRAESACNRRSPGGGSRRRPPPAAQAQTPECQAGVERAATARPCWCSRS